MSISPSNHNTTTDGSTTDPLTLEDRTDRNDSNNNHTRAAFHQSYGPVDESDHEEEEDGLHDTRPRGTHETWQWFSKDTVCVLSVGGLLLVAVLLAIVQVTLGPEPTPLKDSTTSLTEENCGWGAGWGEQDSDDSRFETCWDPVLRLEPRSSKTNLRHGAVASDHATCSQLGTRILQDGGNAVDAAVTTALCLGVANPSSSGLGGGAFLVIHSDAVDEAALEDKLPPFVDARETSHERRAASGKITEVIDCRETAPQSSYQDMYLNQDNDSASTLGGLAVAIPGELKGLELAHARHGTLPWEQVVQPVADLARQGVAVNTHLAKEIQWVSRLFRSHAPKFTDPLRKVLTSDDNWKHPLKEGDLMHNPQLASTLAAIAKEGSAALWGSAQASKIAKEIQAAGGVIQAEELTSFQPILRSPVLSCDVFGFCLAGVPPPSSGGSTILFIARFLSGFSLPLSSYAETLSKHWYVEACRHAFAIRMSLSDPAFNSETVQEAVSDLVDSDYVDQLRAMTSSSQPLASISQYGGEKWSQLTDEDGAAEGKDAGEGDRQRRIRNRRRYLSRTFGYLEDHGTSHFSVVDKDGNAVSMTSSINTVWGSCVVSESTGVLLNNQMDDFATPGRPNTYGLAPAESNFISPGKKPLSSMSPTLVFRKDIDPTTNEPILGPLVLALGSSGGPKIITAVAQVLLNFVVLGKPLFESIRHARIHDQLIYNEAAVTTVENSTIESGERIVLSQETRESLKRRKHNLLDLSYMGAVQAVVVNLETNTLDAACDIRKGGEPDGY